MTNEARLRWSARLKLQAGKGITDEERAAFAGEWADELAMLERPAR